MVIKRRIVRPNLFVIASSRYHKVYSFLSTPRHWALQSVSKLLICILTLVSLTAPLNAQDMDYLALASVLLRDGNYARAASALKKSKLEWEDIEQEHYYLLNGLFLLRTNNVDVAIVELQKVKDEEYLLKKFTYLSEAYLKKKEPKSAFKWINKINIDGKTPSAVRYLKAKVLFENKRYRETLAELNALMPSKQLRTFKLMTHYLMEMGLYQQAVAIIREMISLHGTLKPDLSIQMAQLLLSKKLISEAVVLLEETALKFPGNSDVLKLKAATYDLYKKPYVAGDLYTKLAYLDNSYSHTAAEYLMSKGRPDRAQVINIMVDSPKKQLTQKLSFYIEQERYDLARSLETPLKQYNAYEDDEIKYAMAYTFLIQGNYEHSKSLLQSIKKEKLISKSAQLIKLVDDCESNKWECYGTL